MGRNKKGQFISTPKPFFSNGEIVTSSKKHFNPKGLTILTEPSYTKNRGWVYVENYTDLQNNRGGSGGWNEEYLYEKVTNPILRLYASRITLKTEIREHELKLRQKREALGKVEYALSLAVDDWDKVKKICKCGKLFIRNSKNVNLDVCDKCTEAETL